MFRLFGAVLAMLIIGAAGCASDNMGHDGMMKKDDSMMTKDGMKKEDMMKK